MKKDYAILAGLLAVGAIVWYFFAKSKMGQSGAIFPATEVAPDLSPAGGYPNSQPINMGGIEIGGSPINLTYNYPAPVAPATSTAAKTECTNCNRRGSCPDYKGTVPQVRLMFSASDLNSSKENLQGFNFKTGS